MVGHYKEVQLQALHDGRVMMVKVRFWINQVCSLGEAAQRKRRLHKPDKVTVY